MKLWLLRPRRPSQGPWDQYDTVCGFVIRAESESEARLLAQADGAWETGSHIPGKGTIPAWTDPELSTCDELTSDGEAGVVIKDQNNG